MTIIDLIHEWSEQYDRSIADVYRSSYNPKLDLAGIEFLKIRVVDRSVNSYLKDRDKPLLVLVFRDFCDDENIVEVNLAAPDSLDRIKKEVDWYLGLSFVSNLYQR